ISNLPTKHGLFFPGSEVGWIGAALPIGGIISPIFVGLFADRFFATERVLAFLHVAGGILIGLAAWFCDQNLPAIERAFDSAAAQTRIDGTDLKAALATEDDLKRKAAEGNYEEKLAAQERLDAHLKDAAYQKSLQEAIEKVRSSPEVAATVNAT